MLIRHALAWQLVEPQYWDSIWTCYINAISTTTRCHVSCAILKQPLWIHPVDRIAVDVAIEALSGTKAQRVGLEVAAEAGVIIAVPVLDQAGFSLFPLSRKAQIDGLALNRW